MVQVNTYHLLLVNVTSVSRSEYTVVVASNRTVRTLIVKLSIQHLSCLTCQFRHHLLYPAR